MTVCIPNPIEAGRQILLHSFSKNSHAWLSTLYFYKKTIHESILQDLVSKTMGQTTPPELIQDALSFLKHKDQTKLIHFFKKLKRGAVKSAHEKQLAKIRKGTGKIFDLLRSFSDKKLMALHAAMNGKPAEKLKEHSKNFIRVHLKRGCSIDDDAKQKLLQLFQAVLDGDRSVDLTDMPWNYLKDHIKGIAPLCHEIQFRKEKIQSYESQKLFYLELQKRLTS